MTFSKPPSKPTKEELAAARNRTVADVIDYNLKILFCGINPGLYSGATGYNFANPGNRFWKVIHLADFTNRLLQPWEQNELIENGCGITSFVKRTTARADELTREEIVAGRDVLEAKLAQYRPQFLAVLGIGAYKTAYSIKTAKLGLQDKKIGETKIWLLPNPSGLNAHYQLRDFVELFTDLRDALKF